MEPNKDLTVNIPDIKKNAYYLFKHICRRTESQQKHTTKKQRQISQQPNKLFLLLKVRWKIKV